MTTTYDRFWSYVDTSADCWVWTGGTDRDGYGMFGWSGRPVRAYRVALLLEHVELPTGMVVDHMCRNRLCVRREHLRVVTPRINALENSEGVGAVNARKTACVNGHVFTRENTYLWRHQRKCRTCMTAQQRALQASYHSTERLPKPTKEELAADMSCLPWTHIGQKYGVSDNGARRWARTYGLL